MTIKNLTALCLTLAVTLLAGCASSQAPKDDSKPDRVCIRVKQINSYSVIDNEHVFVNVTGKDNYMLTVDRACPGLTFARGIAISEHSTRVCGDGSGQLTFNQPGVGLRRCRIIGIDLAENDGAAKALIADRAKDVENSQE